MSLKTFLVAMTVIAVISDSMLHPFYPQYFAEVFGLHDAQQVGLYISACSLTVLVTFPGWAWIARKLPVLPLLIATQIATCALSVASFASTHLLAFWLLSLTMMVFKASYLLLYPYVMSLDDKDEHLGTISLLAFMVTFGNIVAALFGGGIFQLAEARFMFLAMAAGDALQIALCVCMLRATRRAGPAQQTEGSGVPRSFLVRIGLVMFVLYFSAYLGEPFFSHYWEGVSTRANHFLSGAVFAVPGLAALLGLIRNARSEPGPADARGVAPAILMGVAGLGLQTSPTAWLILLGRLLYGWALFQSMVRLDALLFAHSSPDSYALDFSKANLFQGLGVLCASASAGALVTRFGERTALACAALGFALGGWLFVRLLRTPAEAASAERLAPSSDDLPDAPVAPANQGAAT